MSCMIEIKVRLFGAFRKYETDQAFIFLEVPEASSVERVKTIIASHLSKRFMDFSDDQLIRDSVIADEKRVLEAGDIVNDSCTLAILPPVCGG